MAVRAALAYSGYVARAAGVRRFHNKCLVEDPAKLLAATGNFDEEAIAAQTGVALSLSKQLLADSKATNFVFSPPSIHTVLSLIAAGSGGRTRSELLSFLKSPSAEHLNSFASDVVAPALSDGSHAGGPKLSFANGLWLDTSLSLKQPFKQAADTSYKAATKLADFRTKAVEVTREVNGWAKKETRGLVKEVLPTGSVDRSTRLIFANALYFKGAWSQKFDKSETRDAKFHLLDGRSVQVPFMTSKKKRAVRCFRGFKVLGLPYRQGGDERDFSMYLFLPNKKDGFPSLAEKLCSDPRFLESHLPWRVVEVGEFKIPRFKISFGFEAKEVLGKLGVVSPFSQEADLTKMVDSEEGQGLYVSEVFHKSFIEVNEAGTKAAAASAAAVFKGASSYKKKIDFVADHPFLFVIREDVTGMVLFIGQVLDPSTV